MFDLFTRHPQAVGETYFEHLKMAASFGLRMMFGGLACIAHGLFPFLCIKTGSNAIVQLHDRMVVNRTKLPKSQPETALTWEI